MTYQGGPVDVETLLVDPRTDAKLLVSKQLLGGDVFALPDELTAGADNLATPVGADVPLLVTDGAFTPDGGRVVLRTYTAMHELDPAGWSAVATQRLPDQKQGESLAVEAGGRSVLVGSEGDDSALLRVPLPATAVPTTSPSSQPPAPSAARSSGPAPSSDGFRKPGASGFAGASFVYAALAVLLLVGLLALLTRRRPR